MPQFEVNGGGKIRNKHYGQVRMLRKKHSRFRIVLRRIVRVFFCLLLSIFVIASRAQSLVIDSAMHNLRNGESQEWAWFPTIVRDRQLTRQFKSNAASKLTLTLSLRQNNVKQNWRIFVNDTDIGGLMQDEKDMITYISIPSHVIRIGQNTLSIKAGDNTPDDIAVGHLTLHFRPIEETLSEAKIDITVVDEGSANPLPSRITIVNNKGVLQTVTATSDGSLAVRPGYVYTSNGNATIALPRGQYVLYAGRGFEYSIDSIKVNVKRGEKMTHTFKIKKEVETAGWVSSDTHVHTFTHSRHGDATIEERAITIAGEGIELPIMTDHNQNIDIISAAKATGVLDYFTPVTGNELTTKVGHFNIFKTDPKQSAVSAKAENWNDIASNINNKDNHLGVILNHARDIHNGFRPFDPSHHISSAGHSTLGWTLPANAMEVINSGSQQTNILTLYQDWFGMLNHGHLLTPVGSSDSHDVSRFTVGQGRTYIRTNDTDASNINVGNSISSFIEGRVLVSLGLLTKLSVGGRYGPGDLCPRTANIDVSVEVLGPGWAHAEEVSLYLNGVKVKHEKITNSRASGVKWRGEWSIPAPGHDVFLVAIAEGNGTDMPYWPIAEPYQPMSIEWKPRLIGSTGAVWVDGDGDGKRKSALSYAQEIIRQSGNDQEKIIRLLSKYDESVAIQVAVLLWKEGTDLSSQELQQRLLSSTQAVRNGFSKATEEIGLIR